MPIDHNLNKRFAQFTWSRLSQVLSIDSNHTHCAQHSSIISLPYNLEFQLFSFCRLNARLIPLELLCGGDPVAGGLVGQPLVVELPHLEKTFHLKHCGFNNLMVNIRCKSKKNCRLGADSFAVIGS